MVHRKGELKKASIDRGWPHQVALPSPQVVAEFVTIREFCAGLSLCIRGHWFRRNGLDYVVHCFAEREHAERFATRFDGEHMSPETRPPWIERR